MLNQETKRKIDNARDILVGKVPDPKAQVEQITTALIYKFMDDMDKESIEVGGKARFFSGEYEKYAWSKLLDTKLGGQDRANLYVEALGKFSQNQNIPEIFRKIFKDAFLPYRDSETLNLFLKEVNGFSYDHSEDLGDAYEYLLSVLGSQGDAGQFRTPRHIIDFIVEVLDPQKTDTILDPACGTAGFLISAYKHILKQHDGLDENGKPNKEKILTPDERKQLINNFTGYDISPDMVRISLVNMYLHGFQDPKIFEYDTLTSEDKWEEHFDVILANPPFMTPKGGIRPHKRFSVQASRSEVLFVNYIVEHLKQNGRAGIIVPEGIIFQNGNAYKQLRKQLINEGLFAVVSLPAGVFNPYSGVKTSILFFDKQFGKNSKNILFLNAEADGYELGAQRKISSKNDLPLLQSIIKAWKNGTQLISDLAIFVSKSDVMNKEDYNLTGNRYKNNISLTKNNWPSIYLKDIAKLNSGGTPSRDNPKFWSNGNIKWISAKYISEDNVITGYEYITKEAVNETSTYLVPRNSIIFVTRVSVGKLAMTTEEYAVNQDITSLQITDSRINPLFLFAYLKSQSKAIATLAQGLGVKGITRKDFGNIKIPLLPTDLQEELLNSFFQYQKVIDGAKQIVKYWKPVLKMNKNWEYEELGDLCLIERGASPRPIDNYLTNAENGLNWIKIGDTKNTIKYIYKTEQKITREGAAKSRYVSKGDFLLSNSMSFGRPYILDTEGYIHDGWLKLSAMSDRIDKNFLYYVLLSDEIKKQFDKYATGGVVRNLNSSLVKNIRVPVPPIEVQKKLASELDKELQTIELNKELLTIYESKMHDLMRITL